MTLMKKCHTIRPPNEQHTTPILGSNSHEAADRQTHARTHARCGGGRNDARSSCRSVHVCLYGVSHDRVERDQRITIAHHRIKRWVKRRRRRSRRSTQIWPRAIVGRTRKDKSPHVWGDSRRSGLSRRFPPFLPNFCSMRERRMRSGIQMYDCP